MKSALCLITSISILTIAVLAGCGDTPIENAQNFLGNRAPEISSFTDNYEGDGSDLIQGKDIEMAVEASDPEDRELTYEFTSDKGSFQNQVDSSDGSTVTFIVGAISGGDDITATVRVTDSKGASTSLTLNISQGGAGPHVTQVGTPTNNPIPAAGSSVFTFKATKEGYYQVRVLTESETIDPNEPFNEELPIYTYKKDVEKVVNVYGPDHGGNTPPFTTLDPLAGKMRVCVIVVDKLDQAGWVDFTYSLDGAPVPGGSKVITVSNLDRTTLTLNWTKATDDLDDQNLLEYKIVRSSINNINTVSKAEDNGTVIQDWTMDIASVNVAGLLEGTNYYFNVIVKDTSGSKSVYTMISQTTLTDEAPVPGGSKIITVSNVEDVTLTLNWTKATDDFDDQNLLQYKVVRSIMNNINTVYDAETWGTVIQDWTTYTAPLDVSGILKDTTHYFNVIVKDTNENKAVYQTVSAMTKTTIYMFSSVDTTDGEISQFSSEEARTNANSICINRYNADHTNLNCTHSAIAFLGMTETDSLANMSANYGVPTGVPVRGYNGTLIDNNWSDLINEDGSSESIITSMYNAGVTGITTNDYWTGSNQWGQTKTSFSCGGWTNNNDKGAAMIGEALRTDSRWIALYEKETCDQQREFLCICW